MLWLIYDGGGGACIMLMEIHTSPPAVSDSQCAQAFLLFTSDHKHMRRSYLLAHKLCLTSNSVFSSPFTMLSPKLVGFPHKNFPTKSIPPLPHRCYQTCSVACSPLPLVLPFPSSLPVLLSCWAWCCIPDPPMGPWLGPLSRESVRSLTVALKARSCTRLHIQTSMLFSLLLTNRTFLQSPSKTMKCEQGCSILLFSALDGCCTALTATVPTCWACLCYVMQPNSARCGSVSFTLSRRRRRSCKACKSLCEFVLLRFAPGEVLLLTET